MPKARDYHLIEQEFKPIEAAIRGDKRPEVRQRRTAIRLLHLGHKPKEVAHMQAASIPTIYGWYIRWRQDGIVGLATKPRSDRPSKTGEEYLLAVEEALETEPQAFGDDFSLWTIDRLRLHLANETGIALSAGRLPAKPGYVLSESPLVAQAPLFALEVVWCRGQIIDAVS